MQSPKIDIFFSCSFEDEDQDVNDFFLAICQAIDFSPVNVSTGSTRTPPDVAKAKISDAGAVLAVCTKRSELKSGEFVMPQAVRDEISFAFGASKPLLILKEEGVQFLGFGSNFGTYLPFSRGELSSPTFIRKAVEAIHQLKMEALGPQQMMADLGLREITAEYMHHLVELKYWEGQFKWHYTTSRKLIYLKKSDKPIPSLAWATIPTNVDKDNQPLVEYSFELIGSSRDILIDDRIEEHNQSCVKSMMHLSPTPIVGDYIEYTTTHASRYLNPVWAEDAQSPVKVHMESGDFLCVDGFVPLHTTKRLLIEFRFPKQYELKPHDFQFFVGSLSGSSLDYEMPTELARANSQVFSIGGNYTARMEVEGPVPGHMYGVAWNPPQRPN